MKILYLTGGYFPKGSAYASRVLNISKTLLLSKHEVYVIADYSEDNRNNFSGNIDGINYTLLNDNKLTHRQYIAKYLSFVNEYLNNNKVDLVISSSDHDRFARLFKIVKAHNIPLVLESCEWFGPYNWKMGILNPRYYLFTLNWIYYYRKVDGVIAISRLLEQHYSKYVKNVIRIPTVLSDTSFSIQTRDKADDIKIIYAGNAGKSKDLLRNIIEAINIVNSEKRVYSLDIFGIDKKTVSYQLGRDYKRICEKEFVRIHGRVPQDKINGYYQQSDFSVLFRPQRRSSNAGFPTKLAESMMAGTPVFCNDTGDVSLYIKDGVNGWIVCEENTDSISEKLLAIKNVDFKEVKKEAHKSAMEAFYYKNYAEKMDYFLRGCLEK